MKVIKNLNAEINGTNVHYFHLDEFSNEKSNTVLFYGYDFIGNKKNKDFILGENKIYFNVTMPTEYCGVVDMERDNMFDVIYGICPYTVNWLNNMYNTNKYKFIFYPFNKNNIPKLTEKKYDVCYHGGIHGDTYSKCLDIMRKFNYRYMSMDVGINGITRNHLKYATNTNLTNQEKINLISECKISICYNTFPVRGENDLKQIKSFPNWKDNEAFKHIDDIGIIPQFKSRFNEAAMSRTLNLIQKDPWNIVENFYIPNEDFIYFKSNDELEEKIKNILNNWDDYSHIIDNAYNKSMNFTTEKLYHKIKEENEL